MKQKLTILAFSLLLAVGWTNSAQAQLLAGTLVENQKAKFSAPVDKNTSVTDVLDFKNLAPQNGRAKAPRRAENNITASATLTFAEADAITYDWVDANNTLHRNVKITEAATNPYQIAFLLGTTYMNPDIPGLKYSAVYDQDNPYRNIEFGWDIPHNERWNLNAGGDDPAPTTYNDITINIPSWLLDFDYIYVQSNGTTVEGGSWSYAVNGTSLPTGWGGTATLTAENNGCCTQQGGATIIIPHSIIDGKENVTVVMSARKYSSSSSSANCTVTISGATPESNEYTTTSYTEKTWRINPQSGGSSGSGTNYSDLKIYLPSTDMTLYSITVKNANGTTLTFWNATTAINNSEYASYTGSDNNTYYAYTLPGWSYNNYFTYYYYNSTPYGYMPGGGTITIPADLFNGTTSISVVIQAYSDTDGEELYVNGEGKPMTTSLDTYTWTFEGDDYPTTVTPPRENGYTIFLVKVKDYVGAAPTFTFNWDNGSDNLIDYFTTYIDEVQLLTDGTRLNENTDDAGTMFAYSGELNRFYFLGKGNDYWWGSSESDSNPHLAPTYDMYEEFSPTSTDAGDETTDFYSKLLYGNSYNVIHDCRGMNYFQHYFSMSGLAGDEHRSMTNLIFWIPDNRGEYGERNYNEEYLPHVGLYTITLEAEAQPAADYSTTNRMYDVTLDWVSSLNSILDFDVDQDYELWVYIYDDQGNPIEDYKILDYLQMQDLLIHNNTTFTYQVPQIAESQTIVYRVKGWPKDASNNPAKGGDFFALSNLDPVLIPGYNDFLSLGVEHYESDFALDVEHNYYRNFLTVDNQNPDNALTAARIENGEDHYVLERYDATDENNPKDYIKAADLTFSVANNKVSYNIAYANQFYIDEANLYNEYNHANISGYTDLNALGCPTSGDIANISEGGGETPIVNTYDDIVITASGSTVGFKSIYVYADGTEVTSWETTTSNPSLPSTMTPGGNYSYNSDHTIWLYSPRTITISHDLIDGKSNVQVVIHGRMDSSTGSGTVTIGNETWNLSGNSDQNHTFSISPSGSGSGSGNFTLLSDFLDNTQYTDTGQVVFTLPWKSIQVKLQDSSAGTSKGYFLIQNGGRLRFIMPAGYNNASLKFVIHNAPVSSNYFDGSFTLTSSTGDTQTITIPKTSNYGDRDYEAIFMGISSGDVITIRGTHTVDGTDYNYSPDFKYIHVYVAGGHDGISENTALNLDAIKFVDQFKAPTDKDEHPYRYGYVLKQGNQKSGEPKVPVLHTNSSVNGFYSLNEINDDIDAFVVDPVDVMNAEVNMTLSRDPEIFYYTLDRKPSNVNNAPWEAVSKLQRREDDSYQEMFDNLPQYEDQICNPPALNTTPWIVDRYDNDDYIVGGYNDYMSYVPVIWAHGDQKNRRVKWNTENRHNSYGAPIWKTGVAKVEVIASGAERQEDASTKWIYNGEECSLYMLDHIEAQATMPTVNNVKYVPYMFRIFVKSDNHKLRDYTSVAEGVDPDLPGEHVIGVPNDNDSLLCIWSGYVNDPNNAAYGVTVTITNDANGRPHIINFTKDKVERTQANGDWDKTQENAIFGALENVIQGTGENLTIANGDLSFFVRFYYIVEGFNANPPANKLRDGGSDDPAGYGTESPGSSPDPSTGISEIGMNTQIVSTTYVNAQGMQSDKPFEGVNIVITRYSNGMTRTTKVVRR